MVIIYCLGKNQLSFIGKSLGRVDCDWMAESQTKILFALLSLLRTIREGGMPGTDFYGDGRDDILWCDTDTGYSKGNKPCLR